MSMIFNWVFRTVVGRWVTGILVASLLSGAAWKFHAWKEDLIHRGQQVCVQEINKETVAQLQDALAAEKSAFAVLTAKMVADAAVNEAARDRRRELEKKITSLEKAMAEQRKTDEEYKVWADTRLPSGVADRLRDQAARRDPDPLRDDRN